MCLKSGAKVAGIFLLVVMLGGCLLAVGAALGIGAYTWVEGTMAKDYPRLMEPTYRACIETCKIMALSIEQETYDPTNSYIRAVTKDGTKVDINLIARPNNITTVKVRFGLMGNKDQSAYFHRNVMRILGIE
jgi:hypothetical protein